FDDARAELERAGAAARVAYGERSEDAAQLEEDLGNLASEQHDATTALAHYRRSVELLEAVGGDAQQVALERLHVAHALLVLGRHEEAIPPLRAVVAAPGGLYGPTSAPMALAHRGLGTALEGLGRLDEARVEYEAARDVHRALGDAYLEAIDLAGLATIALSQGAPARAVDHAEEAVRRAELSGRPLAAATMRWVLAGALSAAHREPARARALAEAARRELATDAGQAETVADIDR